MKKKIISAALSLSVAATVGTGFALPARAAANTPKYQATARQMEELNRGLVAIKTEKDTREQSVDGVYLSWRLLGTESLENQAFDIYKNGTRIKTTGAHDATCYVDNGGKLTDAYKVVPAGEDASGEPEVTPMPNSYYAKPSEVGNGNSEKNSVGYVDIPIERPDDVARMGDGKTSHYHTTDGSSNGGANDGSVGDLDGDGDYEIVLKWDPSDSKDSAGADFTGNVYIDAYEIDPTMTAESNPNGHLYKWRIDLGKNVTAGAHYTQFIVYDFDGDGRAEVAMKTAPGSVDGTGHYVSEVGDTEEIRNVDNTAQFIGTSGRLKGKNPFTQYLTIFDGETGQALYTTEYIPFEAAAHTNWGDDGAKYNRSERYLAGVAYLDGVHPSLIMCRGYYHDAVIRAYNWDGSELSMLWEHNGGTKAADSMYGQGNHNLSIADVDNDGKDEIVYGSAVLDDNGKAIGNTYLGHGDALHVNDFNNDGVQEVFSVKEDSEGYKNNAADFRVAATGKNIWGKGASGDTGRGVMDNIDDEYAAANPDGLALAWTSSHDNLFDLKGGEVAAKPTAGSRGMTNFLVFWDADLGRELLDDTIMGKYHVSTGGMRRFYSGSDGYSLMGASSNNDSKQTPTLVADLWGDWREEVIMPVGKGETDTPTLRIYTSALPTTYRLATLMHDSQYRCSVAWQNVGYNQPTHTSYYVGSAALAADDSGNKLNYLAPATAYTSVVYQLDNIPVTGIAMNDTAVTVEKGKTAAISASVVPSTATKKSMIWTSSNTAVATVANGTVKGVSEGTATITATTRDGGYSASCEVTVYATHVTGVTLSDSSIDLGTGSAKTLTARVSPSDATDSSVKWTTSNSAVALVGDDGTVTGVSNGTAIITATTNDGGYSASCTVNVFPLITTDVTGTNSFVFVGENTEENTAFTADAANAALSISKSNAGATVEKTFEAYSDNKAEIRFKFTTGGQKYNGSDSDWNWDGHEYSFGLKFLDTENNNILTLSQAYTSAAEETMSQIAGESAAAVSSAWTKTVSEGENPVKRSSARWILTLSFDYDNDTCTAEMIGCTSAWEEGMGITYEKTFPLNGASFEKLQLYVTKDGDGDILTSPKIEGLSYTRTTVQDVSGVTNLLYNKGTSADTAWTDGDVADWTQVNKDTAALALGDGADNGRVYYSAEKPGAAYSATKAFDLTENSVVTYNAGWYFGNAIDRASNALYIQFGSNLRIGWTVGYGTYISTDGGATYPYTLNDDNKTIADNSSSIFNGANQTYTKNVSVTIDSATNTIKSLSFDGVNIDAYTDYQLPEDATVNSVSFGLQRGGATASWAIDCGLDSLIVSEFVEGAQPEPSAEPSAEPSTEPSAEPSTEPSTEPFASGIEIISVNESGAGYRLISSEDCAKAAIIGAMFDETGKLIEVKTEVMENIAAGAEENGVIAFNSVRKDGCTIKIMAWESISSMNPLCAAGSLTAPVPAE